MCFISRRLKKASSAHLWVRRRIRPAPEQQQMSKKRKSPDEQEPLLAGGSEQGKNPGLRSELEVSERARACARLVNRASLRWKDPGHLHETNQVFLQHFAVRNTCVSMVTKKRSNDDDACLNGGNVLNLFLKMLLCINKFNKMGLCLISKY